MTRVTRPENRGRSRRCSWAGAQRYRLCCPSRSRRGIDVAPSRHGRRRHRRVGEDLDHRLGRGVDGAALAFVAAPRGPQRLQGLPLAGGLERVHHLVSLLLVDPAHDVDHGAPRARRRPGAAAPRSLAAVAYQKSPSVSAPADVRPASTRPSAMRRAPDHVAAAVSGDQWRRLEVGRRRGVVDPHLALPSDARPPCRGRGRP